MNIHDQKKKKSVWHVEPRDNWRKVKITRVESVALMLSLNNELKVSLR